MGKLRVFEAFSGVGSQTMALKNISVPFERVAISEIDKYATKSYGAIHNNLEGNLEEFKDISPDNMSAYLNNIDAPLNYKTFKCEANKLKGKDLLETYGACNLTNNLGNIAKINTDNIPDHDLFTYSFPCQDVSISGKQAGLNANSGSRSSLLWECKRIITAKRPKYLLLENVKNLVGKNHKADFDVWLNWLESQGYSNSWAILDASKFGSAQSRDRVFVVSVLGDKPISLENLPVLHTETPRLIDILEPEVDEKYYLNAEKNAELFAKYGEDVLLNPISERKVNCIGGQFQKGKSNPQAGRIYNIYGLAPTLNTMQGGWRQPSIVDYKLKRIRKLTPLECWRLMGFTDEDFYKAKKYCSDSQLYKQAGNSISVEVLESIFYRMFKEGSC